MADSYYEKIHLGESFDCEDCGTSYDSIGITQMSEGSYYIHRELGCYGGFGEEFDTVELATERLEKFISEELGGKKNKRQRNAVRYMIREMQEHNRK